MTQRSTIIEYLHDLLAPESFQDYCPNGLQVEGAKDITRIVTGVTACQRLIDKTVDVGAELLLVHHGFFWRGESPCVVGIKQRRIKTLLTHNINLVAYHLPLDAEPTYGNNQALADLLDIEVKGGLDESYRRPIGLWGAFKKDLTPEALTTELQNQLGRTPLHIAGSSDTIKTVAWCTGAAQSMIDKAIALGVDAYITGEVSEPTVHTAREAGIHFYAAGHHATERYGVKALGEHLAQKFGITHQFIDIENPV